MQTEKSIYDESGKTYSTIKYSCGNWTNGSVRGDVHDVTHRCESRKENPQKLTQLSSRSHPRHLVGKRTSLKDTTIDITSDSDSLLPLALGRPAKKILGGFN